MGFNLFLYGFIIFGLLCAKSYDYEPHTNESEDNKYNKNDIIE